MTSGISGLPAYVDSTSTKATTEQGKLGRDDFLKLFLAQMNHQDPLNPMDTSQFSSQLAQFSTLEQLYNVNDNLQSIESIQKGDSKYQTLDMIGKEVQAESDTLVLNNGNAAKGAFNLEQPAECMVHILDDNGNSIRDIYLGVLDSGNHDFEWDGFENNGTLHTSGQYTYSVSAMSNSGKTVSTDKYIKGTVTGVNLNGDDPVIYINDTPLSMSQIVNVSTDETTGS